MEIWEYRLTNTIIIPSFGKSFLHTDKELFTNSVKPYAFSGYTVLGLFINFH